MKRILVPLAIGLATVYLALAVGAAGCLFEQPEPSAAHHHHQKSHVAHSAFCAWACQANPTVSESGDTPLALVFHLVALLIFVRTSVPLHLATHAAHSRAPPR